MKVTGLTGNLMNMEIEDCEEYDEGVSRRWEKIDIECPSDLQDILLVVSDGSERK